jgi:hypothetical protein
MFILDGPLLPFIDKPNTTPLDRFKPPTRTKSGKYDLSKCQVVNLGPESGAIEPVLSFGWKL